MKIQIKILNKEFYGGDKTWHPPVGDNLDTLPSYATRGSCGMDLRSTQDITLYPGDKVKIPTGLAIWIGSQHRDNATNLREYNLSHYQHVGGLVIPKSGRGFEGLVLANTIGLIDEDYQGELEIAAWNRNLSLEECLDPSDYYSVYPIKIKAGQKIAQIVFIPVIKAQWEVVDEFSSKTERGEGGFGSSGL